MASQSVVPKKKRGPDPTGKGTQVQVRVQPDLLEALDKLVDALSDDGGSASRADALRFALRTYMESDGFLSHRPRLPRHYLIELNRPYAEALTAAFGEKLDDQLEAIADIVIAWLRDNGYLKGYHG